MRDASGYVDLDGLAISCRADPFEGPVETAFSAFQPAPPATGVRATSIVNLIASEDTILRHGAAYLVAQFPQGLCWVDEVLSWNKSYSSQQFATHWSSKGQRLHVQAHRTVYMILDQEELSSGESNVESEECVRLEYQVVGGRFAWVGERSTPGACEAAKRHEARRGAR